MDGIIERQMATLPPELQEKVFDDIYPDLRTLRQQGHILLTQDRTVSPPPGIKVRVFAVGAGGLRYT